MRTWMITLVVWAGMASPAQVPQSPAQGLFHQHLADYDAELRRADGRVDIDTLVARLKELGVTTYYWLIWHAPTDWDDLKLSHEFRSTVLRSDAGDPLEVSDRRAVNIPWVNPERRHLATASFRE